MGKKKKNEEVISLNGMLKEQGVDVVWLLGEMLKADTVSTKTKADLIKECLSYQFAKQKAVAVDLDTGSGVTFNLNMTGKG